MNPAFGVYVRVVPVPVSAPCTGGVTTANEVYCWGSTKYGRLGPAALGTDFSMVSTTPVKITP